MTTRELTCKELVELLTEYLEGALRLEEKARLEAHLDECAACRAYAEQMRATIRLVGELRTTDVSPDAEAALRGVLRDWQARRWTP